MFQKLVAAPPNQQQDRVWVRIVGFSCFPKFKNCFAVFPSVFAASYGAYPICKGCSVCSRDNGCVNCQPKLFLFLRRERMRQYGECLHDCPAGYYGMRSPELNMCSSKSCSFSNSPNLSHTPNFSLLFPTPCSLHAKSPCSHKR